MLTSKETKAIMDKVAKFCVDHEIVPKAPTVGYGTKKSDPKSAFRLDPSYIKAVAAKSDK